MADKFELAMELYRRGKLDPRRTKLLAELAKRRGVSLPEINQNSEDSPMTQVDPNMQPVADTSDPGEYGTLEQQLESGNLSPETAQALQQVQQEKQSERPMSVAAIGGLSASPEMGGGGSQVQSAAERTLQNIGQVYPALETAANLITSAYGVPASGIAGLSALIAGRGLEGAQGAIDSVQDVLVYTPQTERGGELLETTTAPLALVEKGVSAVTDPIAEAGFPKTAASIKTAAEALPAVAGGRAAIRSGASSLTKQTKRAVKAGVDKAIRPTVAGKGTKAQRAAYHEKAYTAIEEIVANKDNLKIVDAEGVRTGKLPQTLDEFAQAIEQTKRNIFEEYDALAREGAGAKQRRPLEYPLKKGKGEEVVFDQGKAYLEKDAIAIDLKKTAGELETVLNDKILQDFSPETIDYARRRVESLNSRGSYTATEAQQAVKQLNQSQAKYYRDPSPATKGEAFVDSFIANDLRSQTSAAIEGATGGPYSSLKKKYGALKEIEKEVNHRAVVDARKNTKGLIDFTDVMTAGEIVHGVLRSDPVTAAAGVTGKGIAAYYKMLNDPNKIVKGMFEQVEKLSKRSEKKKPKGRAAVQVSAQMAGQEKRRK